MLNGIQTDLQVVLGRDIDPPKFVAIDPAVERRTPMVWNLSFFSMFAAGLIPPLYRICKAESLSVACPQQC